MYKLAAFPQWKPRSGPARRLPLQPAAPALPGEGAAGRRPRGVASCAVNHLAAGAGRALPESPARRRLLAAPCERCVSPASPRPSALRAPQSRSLQRTKKSGAGFGAPGPAGAAARGQ